MEELSGGKFYYNYKERWSFFGIFARNYNKRCGWSWTSKFVAISPCAPLSL